jgi:hypothetical protein
MPPPKGFFSSPTKEKLSFGGTISSFIPASLKRNLAAKSVRAFSKKIGHSLDFSLTWS